jgi:hypothetical protein
MTIFLELGQRPDEPGPPINASAYPPEVFARLEGDAKRSSPATRARAPRCCRCCIWSSPRTAVSPWRESRSARPNSA